MRQFPPVRVDKALRFLDTCAMMERCAGLYLLFLLTWDGARLMGWRNGAIDFLDGILVLIAYLVVLPVSASIGLVSVLLFGLALYWCRRGWIEVMQVVLFLRPAVSSSVIAIGAIFLGWRW